jgi:hypothetical protein
MKSSPSQEAAHCPECGLVSPFHEEWCSIGRNWLPEWFKRWQLARWQAESISQYQRNRWGFAILVLFGVFLLIWLFSGCCANAPYSPLCIFGTDIGAPDYGAREMPKQPPGMSDDDYWKMLQRERWF